MILQWRECVVMHSNCLTRMPKISNNDSGGYHGVWPRLISSLCHFYDVRNPGLDKCLQAIFFFFFVVSFWGRRVWYFVRFLVCLYPCLYLKTYIIYICFCFVFFKLASGSKGKRKHTDTHTRLRNTNIIMSYLFPLVLTRRTAWRKLPSVWSKCMFVLWTAHIFARVVLNIPCHNCAS